MYEADESEINRWRDILDKKLRESMVREFGQEALNGPPLDGELVERITARAFIESAYEVNSDRINRAIMTAWTHLATGECEGVVRDKIKTVTHHH